MENRNIFELEKQSREHLFLTIQNQVSQLIKDVTIQIRMKCYKVERCKVFQFHVIEILKICAKLGEMLGRSITVTKKHLLQEWIRLSRW